MIELRKVNKSYKSNVILKNVDLKLTQQKIKIKGVNGAGKSVLLKVIVGYSRIDSGEVIIDNKRLLTQDYDFIQNAGVSINSPEFIKSWTGRENLEYLRCIKKISSSSEMNKLINYFSLDKDINKKYKTYSLGMKQKLRIIQALLDKPKYLILDEPFDALDKAAKISAQELISNYLNEDLERMLIFTSHDESDNSFANEMYIIENYTVNKIDET